MNRQSILFLAGTSCLLIAGCGDIVVPTATGSTDAALVDKSDAGGETSDQAPDSGSDIDEPDVSQCTFGVDLPCDDQDSCTVDSCSTAGTCVHAPATGVCKVGNQCFGAGAKNADNACLRCDTATPTQWTEILCDDGNICTTDNCNFKKGCEAKPVNDGAACDDGLACSKDDHCQAGSCEGTCTCVADGDCIGKVATLGVCEKAVCQDNVCVATSDATKNGSSCSDGNACITGATCSSGTCAGGATTKCDGLGDGPCEEGVCDPATGACAVQAKPEGAGCDDGDPCTGDDVCGTGACGGTPIDCSAYDGACTKGVCENGNCALDIDEGVACDPKNACVEDAICNALGACTGAWNVEDPECACASDEDCADGAPCTADTCDTGTGACFFPVISGTCFVDGACYFSGQTNLANACQRCEPTASQSTWSARVCNDGIACTADTCVPASGCSAKNDDTLTCNDGDLCTKDDHCQAGACVGTCECKVDLDCKGISVAIQACERVGCVGYACKAVSDTGQNGASCEDGDLCTIGETCDEGACVGASAVSCTLEPTAACATVACDPASGECESTPEPENTPCNDKDPCTLTDQCNQTGQCSGTPLVCTAFEDTCNNAVCEAGTCLQKPKVGSLCADTNECTTGDACDDSGVCSGVYDAEIAGCACTGDADCEDGLACTVDSCGVNGECVTTVKDGFCVVAGACHAGGAASPGNPCLTCDPETSKTKFTSLICDDLNPCTDDSCSPASGCVAQADATNACNDNDPCSADDHCDNGQCAGTCECTDDTDCADPAGACKRFACQGFACVEVADTALDGQSCQDGKFCTIAESCQAGTCVVGGQRDCASAGDSGCTAGVCDEGGDACVPQVVADGTGCSDDDPCTLGDTCLGGVCGGSALNCSAQADDCNAAECVLGACQVTPDQGSPCEDGNPCTLEDVCGEAGVCQGTWDTVNCGCTTDADCTDLDGICTTGRCDIGAHECHAEAKIGASCNDGEACTNDDVCGANGLCIGAAYSCDDGLSCTADVCDGTGACTNPLQAGRCLIGGLCYQADQANPANPCEQCTSGTTWTPKNGQTCDDGTACTKSDVCVGGQCKGAPYTCAYLAECQSGVCDGNGGCSITTHTSHCVIDGACVAAFTPNPSNACLSCQPSKSQTGWFANTNACNDNTNCTKDDLCSAGTCSGTAYVCEDGKACTTNICSGDGACTYPVKTGNCLIAGTCYAGGTTNPTNQCELCKDVVSRTVWTPYPAATACNDGLTCTQNDACNATGVCTGSLAGCAALSCETPVCNAQGGCDVTLKTGFCKIEGVCYADDKPNPATSCQKCETKSSSTKWSDVTAGTSCDDSNLCSKTDQCVGGTCKGTTYSCDDGLVCTADTCLGTGACTNKIQADQCLIDGECYKTGESHPKNECQQCISATVATTWTNIPDGKGCGDDSLSCTDDICGSGECTHPYDPASKACLIGGKCYAEATVNPSSECLYCTVQQSTSAWSNRPATVACSTDSNSCTDDKCNGAGSCGHTGLADFTACSDGSTVTYFDWCKDATCDGFDIVLTSGSSTASATNDVYSGGETTAGGHVYGWFASTSPLGQRETDRIVGTTVAETDIVANALLSTFAPGRWLTVNNDLYEYEFSTSGAWDNKADAGTIREKWATLPTTRTFRHVDRYAAKTGLTTVLAVGRTTSNATLAVRRCSISTATVCFPSCSWSCGDDIVTNGTEFPVGAAWLGSAPLVGANYNSETSPTTIDFLEYTTVGSSTTWNYGPSVAVSGNKVLRTIETAGSYVVGAGDNGLLIATTATLATLITVPSFTSQSITDFNDIAVFDGHVYVLGYYDATATNKTRTFVFVIADTSATLSSSASWARYTIESVSDLCKPGADCPNPFTITQMTGLEAGATGLHIFGSWWNSTTKQQDRAVWTWIP